MKDRDAILRENPLIAHLESRGVKVRGGGKQRTATQCAAVVHRKDHWCVSIDADNQLWKCNDCQRGGTIIDWISIEQGKSIGDVMRELSGVEPPLSYRPATIKTPPASNGAHPGPLGAQVKPVIVATYDYVNERGELIFQSVRLEPKSFRQRRQDGHGGWLWNMEGVTRILFNLPVVMAATVVCIAEGEKDAITLNSLGYVATCNVGGAGKWMSAYSERLAGKDVLIFQDNDEPGRKHAIDISASLEGKANSVKIIAVPAPHKDVTEFVEALPEPERPTLLSALIAKTAHVIKPLPIYTLQEMETVYREHAKRIESVQFDLGKFLPDLRQHVRPMIPGEVLLLLAQTGVGKTALLQAMLRAAFPLQVLLFELELPLTLVFERYVQMEVGCLARDVHEEYRDQTVPLWTKYKRLQHIAVCPESGLSTDEIEKLIVRSELKLGRKPAIVAIDYVGLLNSRGTRSRYEAISNAAEQVKVIAKRTETIVLLASQIARKENNQSLEVGLYDGKDSGALENSAGVVLGAWRPEKSRLLIKILKNTSGTSGEIIEANFNGALMQITGQT